MSYTRRDFIQQLGLGCSAIGTTTLLSGITNMGLLNAAAAANAPIYQANEYKALVCILLAGGNDSYNMLIPTDTDNYNDYLQSRGNLGLSNLQAINPTNITDGRTYGLHPNLVKVKQMFNKEAGYTDHNLSFLANVGTLVEPTSLSTYQSDINLPLGLFSHRDQENHWQTSLPQDRNALGWGGRLTDIFCDTVNCDNVSLSISLDGVNTFQRANEINTYSIQTNENGSVAINGSSNNGFYEMLKRNTVDNIVDQGYQNILEQAYANSVLGSRESSLAFSTAIANGMPITTTFEDDNLSKRLLMVARTIAARGDLNVPHQTFFVQLGGFDTHDDDDNERHANLMKNLDDALASFYGALKELGMENNVTTFTISDFARKLISNGNGSDHAWGGHTLVMGGAVNGKKIYGDYPLMYLGNPLDVGEGRIIPTLSCDQYFAELALWFGASPSDLCQILPNITNFWTPQAAGPIGFIN